MNELRHACNVNIDHAIKLSDTPTGSAWIFLLPDGHNSIVILGGANANWKSDDLSEDFKSEISSSSILLL